jgi:6-phosphogluconolactonase (cycloisomerase 2 family)
MIKSICTLLLTLLSLALVFPICSNAQNSRSTGALFAMTNGADHNDIIAFERSSNGWLTPAHRFATGGRGSGGTADPLQSQGSLILTQNHEFLLAANAGSGDISVFRISGTMLQLTDKEPCGGSEPVAIAQYGHLVYVVNAGGNSNVVGFRLNANGQLSQIPGSTAYLSTSNSGPGSVVFGPGGQQLLVTEKVTNLIDVFSVQEDGTLGPIVTNASAGTGAFALSFAPNGTALVSQAPGALSSYAVQSNGTLLTISASVPTLGAATCWQAVTPDGRFVYTSNAGTSTISGFTIGMNGTLTALPGTVVATLPDGSTNLDMAMSVDGKFLYTLDSGTGKVSIFSIGSDGTLDSLGEVGGLPVNAGVNGLAGM